VAVGSELIDNETIKAGKYEVFTERAKQFLAAVKAARS
jgi:2-keto-3-deoxy-6-phosphogluconate aldolase